MGLGTLILALVAGGSAIQCGIENKQLMSHPTGYLDDGTPVYYDRKARPHINGERVEYKYNPVTGSRQSVGTVSGKVYYDSKEQLKAQQRQRNENAKQKAIKEGKLVYTKYDPVYDRDFGCEIATGKYIAYVEFDQDCRCWKYYFDPSTYDRIARYRALDKQNAEKTPVRISHEEYQAISSNCNYKSYSYY